MGLEALSQGAAFAAFLEKDRRSSTLIRENLALLKMEDRAVVFGLDSAANLSSLPKPFDLIFMGPPYKDDLKQPLALTMPTMEQIRKYDLLGADGVVIAQHQKKEPVADNEAWVITRQERYGDTWVSFFRRRQDEQ